VQPGVAGVDVGRVRADREQERQDRAQAVAHAHRAVGPAQADVDVQRERVVAARHVLQALDDAAVVLGVDVRLLAVVRPRVRAGRAERDPPVAGEREQALAQLALAPDRVREVVTAPGADLDLARDQLAGDRIRQQRVVGGRGVAQLLEARDEVERLGVEDGELLLDPDREVGRGREALRGPIGIDRHGA
jgi:hypothetical protein